MATKIMATKITPPQNQVANKVLLIFNTIF